MSSTITNDERYDAPACSSVCDVLIDSVPFKSPNCELL